MAGITIHALTKRFSPPPAAAAVDGIDLTIDSGELFFLLGPSGCGKTTLLRMIAGFIEPTSGSIRFDQREVTQLAPNKRNTGMVFQSYALWPHMSVADNVAYGLDVRKIAGAEKRRRVMEALRSVHMDEYAQRKPNQLSGGQQQRVALARALVIEPTVLLLDEPLSNLDAKLRLEMRSEIRRICKQSGITGVYVTHDQKEALSMADRMAVLRAGKIVQAGPPGELYRQPRTRFVADFLGETNFMEATVRSMEGDHVALESPAGPLHCAAASHHAAIGGKVTCSIRPEAWVIGPSPLSSRDERQQAGSSQAINTFRGRIDSSIYLGEVAQHIITLPQDIHVRVLEVNPAASRHPHTPGDRVVSISVNPDDVVILED